MRHGNKGDFGAFAQDRAARKPTPPPGRKAVFSSACGRGRADQRRCWRPVAGPEASNRTSPQQRKTCHREQHRRKVQALQHPDLVECPCKRIEAEASLLGICSADDHTAPAWRRGAECAPPLSGSLVPRNIAVFASEACGFSTSSIGQSSVALLVAARDFPLGLSRLGEFTLPGEAELAPRVLTPSRLRFLSSRKGGTGMR